MWYAMVTYHVTSPRLKRVAMLLCETLVSIQKPIEANHHARLSSKTLEDSLN